METRPLASFPLPPTTLAVLAKAGYETVEDLSSSTPEALSDELQLPLNTIHRLWSLSQKGNDHSRIPLSQPVATIKAAGRKVATSCPPVDHLLGGGLSRGTILEVSGPPGTAKEDIAIAIVKSFVKMGEQVIFADCQNMTSPATLYKGLSKAGTSKDSVHYMRIHAISDLMVFLHGLDVQLSTHTKVSLLVLNSISFPFQSAPSLSPQSRNSLLDQIKQTLAKVCASHNLTVVTTSQLATKIVSTDGSPANFDTVGSRGIMVPQLGPLYLPSGRSFRLIIAPTTRNTGVLQMLSCPSQHLPKQVEYTLSDVSVMSLHL